MRRMVVTLLGVVGVGVLLVLWFGVGCAPAPSPVSQPASAGPAAPPAPVPAEPPAAVAKAPEPAANSADHLLNVRVADAEGRPVAGVRVQAVARDGGEIRTAVTSEDGGARFVHFEENTYTAFARAEAPDGRVTQWQSFQVSAGTDDYEASLVLQPGAVLSGDVVDAGTGSPVGGAVVSIEEGGATDEHSSSGEGPAFATVATSALGAFGPAAVPRDLVVTVSVRAPNHSNLKWPVHIRGAGDVPRLRLEMEAGGVVVGVVRTPDGTPVAGAHVTVIPADDEMAIDTLGDEPMPYSDSWDLLADVADADGRYRIDRVPLDAGFEILAWAEGWATSLPVKDLLVSKHRPPATADLVLRRLGRLDVLVRDPENRPVAGAHVGEVQGMSPWNRGGHYYDSPVPAGPVPGTYRVDGHFPGKIHFVVFAPGLAPAEASAEIGEGDAREITVRLAPTVSIRGTVLDDRGVPVEGTSVSATVRDSYLWLVDDPVDRPSLTGPDGKFEIPGLAAVEYEVGVESETAFMGDGNLYVGAPAEGVLLRVIRYGTIRFRLRLPPGGPVPHEVAHANSVDDWLDGEFTERCIHPGPGSIRVIAPGYAAFTLDYRVAPGETPDLGEFLLDEGVVVRGRVVDPSGKAVVGATVTLVRNEREDDPQVTTSADGGFEILHGERGVNRLAVARGGFVRGEFTVSGDGATKGPPLVLGYGGLLRVRVLSAAGRPAPYAHVTIEDPRDVLTSDERYRIADIRGACEARLPPGKYGVRARDADSTEVVLAEGGTTEVTLKAR